MAKESLPSEPQLSFERSDIERRIAFPAGRFTSPGPVLSLLGAVVLTVGFYGVLSFLPPSQTVAMFTQRGPVPYAILFLTAWCLMILFIKHRKLALQKKALSIRLLPEDDPGFVLTPSSTAQVLKKLYAAVDNPSHFVLARRIDNALANLRNIRRVADVDEVLRTQAEHDEGMADSSYTVLRGFIWAIPVLGFIGTVQGLSIALGSFWGVVSNSEKINEMRTALQQVTGGLSTAFETTLVGLVAALSVHLIMVMVRRREEQFLDDCKEYCHKYIVSRLRLSEDQDEE